MRRSVQFVSLAAIVCAACLWRPRSAVAQRSELNLPIRPFAVRDVDGWIDFEYEKEKEERILGTGKTAQTEDRDEFSEAIRVNTRSYIYHPYLADLHFSIEGRARQGRREFTPAGGGLEEEDLVADSVLADLTLLKRQPLVTYLFFQRNVSEQDTTRIGTSEVDTLRYGATLAYRNPLWPSSLSVSQERQEGFGASFIDEERRNASFSTSNTTGPLESDFNLAYEDAQDTFRQTESESLEANLRQAVRFGSGDQHSWSSSLQYFDQTGTQNRDQKRVQQQVRLALTDRWSTRVGGSYTQRTLEENSLDTWTAYGEVRHELYDSLTSIARVEAYETTSDFTQTSTQTGELQFRYRKRIPGGQLNVGVLARYLQSNEESTGQVQLVSDESHTFGSGPVLLDNPNVVAGSVTITDPTGLILFVEGIDYLLLPRGQLTEVVQLATGAIPADGTILVDYQFQVTSQLDYDSLLLGTNVRLSLWNWLTLYARYSQDDKNVSTGDPLGRIQDDTAWLVGAQADYGGFTLIGELEQEDTGLTRYQREYVSLAYSDVVFRDWAVFGNAAWTLTSFEASGEDITTIDLRGGLRGTLYRNVRLELDAYLRTETGRKLSPDTDVYGVRAFVEWRYRQVRLRAAFITALEEDAAGQREERNTVTISVRRYF